MRSTWQKSGGIVLTAVACCLVAPATARADRTWNNLGTTPGDWNNALLWTPSGVPISSDKVSIPAKATLSPVNKTSGDSTIRSLSLGGTLAITGGSIKVTGGLSYSSGDLTVGNGASPAALAVDGAGTSFLATAGTFIHNGGDLLATGGASILLNTATSLHGRSGGPTTISATGASKLSLSGVTQITGDASAQTLIKADGGTLDISSVSKPITGNVAFLSQNDSAFLNIPSGGSGWNLQARNNGAVNVAGSGNAVFSKSTIALEDANVFLGTDTNRALEIAADSKLNITAALPFGQVSSIYGKLTSHGQISLAPYSELHLESGFRQYSDGQLTLHLANDLPGFPANAGPVLGVVNGGPGTEINLAGHLTIDSTLTGLPLGYERTIMFATEPIVGHFDTVSGMAQANGMYFVPIYYAEIGAVTLMTTLGGDSNHDGLVDGADYTQWADHYLRSGQTWDTGDFTGDGRVDGADYTLWADHFALGGTSTVSAVPEPATLTLGWIAALAVVACSLRGRSHLA